MNVRRLKNIVTKKITKEIPSSLKYHGLHHTLDVYNACNAYIKRLNIDPYDAYLLRSAALTHDIGILYTYTGHEEEGMKYVKEKLPELGYTKREINKICNLIKATQLPQEPKNLLEEILCDSDLDYIGTDKFYEIGNTLFEEFLIYKVVNNEKEWDMLQIRFLEDHQFHTDFAKRNREPLKQKFLQELKEKWNLNGISKK